MLNLQAMTWIAFVVWLVIGLAIYFLYSRRNAVLGRAPVEAPRAVASTDDARKKRESVTH
jgi:APA family basic amino acid/polyamine antiporter